MLSLINIGLTFLPTKPVFIFSFLLNLEVTRVNPAGQNLALMCY